MRSIIKYFISYPVAGNTLMYLIIAFGMFGYFSLHSTFFPEQESKNITIQATYPGASPEEIEEGVIIKIEDNLKGVTGVERITSVSQENSGVVTVEVEKGYGTDLVLQDVKNAVDRINSFPDGLEAPVIFKQENLNFVISFALSGEVDLLTLKSFARKVETEVRGKDGISKVSLSGFPEEEIEVAFREDDLLTYGLTFQEVAAVVSSNNVEVTGGTIKGSSEELLLRAKAKKYKAADLADLVVKATPDGRLVRLRDVGDVQDRWEDNPDRSYLNGNPSVVVMVQNTIQEDLLTISEEVRKYIEEFNERDGPVKATIIRDGSITLSQRIELLSNNGLIGFVLVLILLTLFLNLRLSFWVAISIPISFLGMFILAAFWGLTINVMSLFGMILVIGILVDDGIVIGESIYSEYEKGKPARQAAIDGTMAVFPAVVAAVLTTVVAFSTFFFLDGRLGEFAPDLAFVVIGTLLFSLVEGAFILPAHIAHSKALASKEVKRNWLETRMNTIMLGIRERVYAPILRFSLTNRFFALMIPVGLFMLTIGGFGGGIIKTTFFPNIERDNISINLEMTAGTREHITEQTLDRIAIAVWEVNEELKADRADGLDVMLNVEKKIGSGANKGKIDVSMLDNETRNMRARDITQLVREKVGPVEGAELVTFGTLSPFGKEISLSLKSNNLEELEGAANELKAAMQGMGNLVDVTDNNQKGIREVNLKLKDKAYLLGLNVQGVMAQVRSGFFGREAQRLQRGIDEVKVWVRYADSDRESLNQLENMRIRLADGKEIPLREVADYEIARGVMAINHLDGRREIRLEADVKSGSASALTAEIRDNILPGILAQYSSISASFEGQMEQSQKTQKSVGFVGPIILLLMLGIITFTFRSFGQALLVILIVPFGFIGVGWGHWIHDSTVSLLSFFGVIALIGIMVNDSLVLVSAYNNLLKEGKLVKEAIYEAGISRFRPIILTSVTTVAGLAPLILEKSFQAQFLVPMAIAIAYGLVVATYTTLVVLPVGLLSMNHLRVNMRWLWSGKKPMSNTVEPAVKEISSNDEA